MYKTRPTRKKAKMENTQSAEVLTDQIGRRFTKSFLDILILQQVNAEPTWGYDIIKRTETQYKVKLRHGALYPMLNQLEAQGLVKSRRELQKGRARKIYEITKDGTQLLEAYRKFISQHLPDKP
jgi:PadR family transcriptional regulator PadR